MKGKRVRGRRPSAVGTSGRWINLKFLYASQFHQLDHFNEFGTKMYIQGRKFVPDSGTVYYVGNEIVNDDLLVAASFYQNILNFVKPLT